MLPPIHCGYFIRVSLIILNENKAGVNYRVAFSTSLNQSGRLRTSRGFGRSAAPIPPAESVFVLLRRWRCGQVRAPGIEHALPASICLLLPDLGIFPAVSDRLAFGVVERDLVGSV